MAGAACSGYITAAALVTEEGLKAVGDSNAFDPQHGYRDAYAARCNLDRAPRSSTRLSPQRMP